MGITALSGPRITFGRAGSDTNGQLGPDGTLMGGFVMDARRPYVPGAPATSGVYGWYGSSELVVLDGTPPPADAVAVCAVQTATVGTPLTLSGAAATPMLDAVAGGTNTQTVVTIGTATAALSFGALGTLRIYDPASLFACTLSVTSTGDASEATFLVAGYDVYGQPLTETIQGLATNVASGRRAFKYVKSIIPQGTLGTGTISVGVNAVYGSPLLLVSPNQACVMSAGAPVAPASILTGTDAATGDPRGTFTLASASEGPIALRFSFRPADLAAASTGSLTDIAAVQTGTIG